MKPSFVALAACSLFWGVVAADEPPGVESDPVKRTKQLEYQVRQLQEENARLKALLAEHGIGGGKSYQSIVEILSQLPAELRNPKGWDKYNSAEVHKWLSEHPIGEPFEATLQIATVQIGKNPYDLGSTTKGWILSVYPTGKDFKFQGLAITQRIGEGGAMPFRLFGDRVENRREKMYRRAVSPAFQLAAAPNGNRMGREGANLRSHDGAA